MPLVDESGSALFGIGLIRWNGGRLGPFAYGNGPGPNPLPRALKRKPFTDGEGPFRFAKGALNGPRGPGGRQPLNISLDAKRGEFL